MTDKKTILIKTSIFIALAFFFLCLFFTKINLVTADLGRHLTNGKLIVSDPKLLIYQDSPLRQNYYSYTQTNFPYVNHHWGFGVLNYLIFNLAGFTGISVFHLIIAFLCLFISWRLAVQMTGLKLGSFIMFLFIPLIAERTEIRPEWWSYLFSLIFFSILWNYSKGKISRKFLYFLPIIEIFWVNLHIYFFFGLVILAVFLLEVLSNKKERIILAKIFTLTTLASLVSPFGLKGAIYPLIIFKNYGYTIVENKSVFFLINYGLKNPNLVYFLIISCVCLIVLLFVLYKKRSQVSPTIFILTLILTGLGLAALRNLSLYALLMAPILCHLLVEIFTKKVLLENDIVDAILIPVGFIFMLLILFTFSERFLIGKADFGAGLFPNVENSAEFFKKENLQGPVFNNYDIGSFLINELYPKEKVFVDNRPEAYDADFMQNTYVAAQNSPEKFAEVDNQYHFNVIFFYYRDMTEWAQNFLSRIVRDPQWASVFADDYAVILVRRNEQNYDVIKKFELPPETFKISGD